MKSTPPPAGNGTMMRIGFTGYVWPVDDSGHNAQALTTSATNGRTLVFIAPPAYSYAPTLHAHTHVENRSSARRRHRARSRARSSEGDESGGGKVAARHRVGRASDR